MALTEARLGQHPARASPYSSRSEVNEQFVRENVKPCTPEELVNMTTRITIESEDVSKIKDNPLYAKAAEIGNVMLKVAQGTCEEVPFQEALLEVFNCALHNFGMKRPTGNFDVQVLQGAKSWWSKARRTNFSRTVLVEAVPDIWLEFTKRQGKQ